MRTIANVIVGNRSLFVAVISAPEYFEKRQTIRETWARHLRHQSDVGVELVGIAFVIGQVPVRSLQKKLEEEGDRHGDILQVSMLDSYYNITLKVAGLLNWLHNNCRTVDFVLKVDDDVYVNVRNLATTLAALPPFYKSMYGSQMPKQGLEPARTKGLLSTLKLFHDSRVSFPISNLRGQVVDELRVVAVALLSSLLTGCKCSHGR